MKVLMTFLVLSLICADLVGADYSKESKEPKEISGLVGYWKFDGDAEDSSGYFNHGEWVGKKNYGQGVSGKAADFDGISNYVTVSSFKSVYIGKDAFSFGAWVNSRGKRDNKNQHFLNKRAGKGQGQFWDMFLSATVKILNAELAGRSIGNSKTNMELNKWHHIMFTRASSGLTIVYVDGKPIQIVTLLGDSSNTYAFNIGNLEEDLSQGFNGLMDEVVVYDRALNEKEVRSLAHTP